MQVLRLWRSLPLRSEHTLGHARSHVVARRVRRACLWGFDEYAGRDYSHRKAWVIERLSLLTPIFTAQAILGEGCANGGAALWRSCLVDLLKIAILHIHPAAARQGRFVQSGFGLHERSPGPGAHPIR